MTNSKAKAVENACHLLIVERLIVDDAGTLWSVAFGSAMGRPFESSHLVVGPVVVGPVLVGPVLV